MITISILNEVGEKAENKDIARTLRIGKIMPELEKGGSVVIDFEGVSDATQSFVHALISDAIRKFGSEVLERISFKSCQETVRLMIELVVGYMQDGVDG